MDNRIEQQECKICRAVGMVLAAIIVGLVVYYLSKTQELWLAIVVLLSLLIFGVFLVNWFCCRTTKSGAEASDNAKVAKATEAVVVDEPEPAAAPEPVVAPEPTSEPVVVEDSVPGNSEVNQENSDDGQPETLAGPRDGKADDLKKIKGVGPKLEKLLNSMGFYHFDQIANWTADEIAWVDANLEGFKGRVSRDNWVVQSTTLATGGDTDFSKKVDKGGVY